MHSNPTCRRGRVRAGVVAGGDGVAGGSRRGRPGVGVGEAMHAVARQPIEVGRGDLAA